jgi:hypothetical protein
MAHVGYILELNNPVVHGQAFARRLSGAGFHVERLPHKTAFRVRYDSARRFVRV